MLKTLLKLGQELSEGRTPWDDIIDVPNLPLKNNKGEAINYFAINLIFDLDEDAIKLEKTAELSFDKNAEYSPHALKYVKVLGGNNKAFYTTVEEKKLNQIPKTFFVTLKNEELPQKSEFMEALEKAGDSFKETQLYEVLDAITRLGPTFYEKFLSNNKFDIKAFKDQLDFGKNEKIGLVFTSVKSTKLNLFEPTPVNQLEGFDEYIEKKFFSEKSNDDSQQKTGLDYVSGDMTTNGKVANFERGYNLNALFVQTTKNYASHFNDKGFAANYQIDEDSRTYLERASHHIVNEVKITIAGIPHTIIPEFFKESTIHIQDVLPTIQKQSELLFKLKELEDVVDNVEEDLEDADETPFFWLNFLAYESDGNFFKIITQIKDISRFHFLDTVRAFAKVHQMLKPWLGSKMFNLQQAYGIIPVRQKHENKNDALILFSDILEQRPIQIEKLYDHFSELIQCHWYKRYESYPNVYSDYASFDFAVKDATFKYSALFKSLQNLGLLTKNEIFMDHKSDTQTTAISNSPEDFFEKMAYKDSQKALFYLGRALNTIAFAQQQQKHASKPILNKLNYNGMDKDDILRLGHELWEKANQYSQVSYNGKPHYFLNRTEWNLKYFHNFFDYEHWKDQDIKEEEALFYILTGYSFGIRQANETEEKTTEQ